MRCNIQRVTEQRSARGKKLGIARAVTRHEVYAWVKSPLAVQRAKRSPWASSFFQRSYNNFPPSFLFFCPMLRFKHSTYHSCFLRFIASTSGLKALHLTRSVTLWHAFALLLSFLSVSHSAALSPSLRPLFFPSVFPYRWRCCHPHLHHHPHHHSLAILLVNYLLYFVSELMSDIKRRTELDSKYKNGFLSVVLDNNYDLPVKPWTTAEGL